MSGSWTEFLQDSSSKHFSFSLCSWGSSRGTSKIPKWKWGKNKVIWYQGIALWQRISQRTQLFLHHHCLSLLPLSSPFIPLGKGTRSLFPFVLVLCEVPLGLWRVCNGKLFFSEYLFEAVVIFLCLLHCSLLKKHHLVTTQILFAPCLFSGL